jgi:inorganic pyrophosphatase
MKIPGTFIDTKIINVVIETPAGSQNKYTYDAEHKFFQLKKILPKGTSFPLDFGFIPNTIGEDGDPLDALVVLDQPAFTGCVVECRVLGVIEIKQRGKSKEWIRNDRFVVVPAASLAHSKLKKIEDLGDEWLKDLINFFKYYKEMEDSELKFLKLNNSKNALKLIKKHL